MTAEIKNPNPEFETFLTRGEAPASESLVASLAQAGLAADCKNGALHLREPLTLLDPKRIAAACALDINAEEIALEIHRIIGSTNDQAMAWLNEPGPPTRIVLAEMQLAGKGRRGRNWVSPFGRNIYLTLGRFMTVRPDKLGGLSLALGMQVIQALRAQGLQGAGLKWPNDVLLNGGKMAGILVELKSPETRGTGVVAGIGINLSLTQADAAAIDQTIDQRWSHAAMQKTLDRNQLAGELISGICAALDRFAAESFAPFQQEWASHNLYQDCKVAVTLGDKTIEGIDRGVTNQGDLILETRQGLMEFNAGEVSLRPMPS